MTAVSSPTKKPKQRRRSCLLGCGLFLLVGLCLLTLVAGGGYYLVQNGQLSLLQLQAQLNGAAEISVTNLADGELTLALTQLDPAAEETPINETIQLESYDIGGRAGLPPGRYELAFSSADGAPAAANCTVRLENGDLYRFVAVPEGIMIVRDGATQTDGAELDVAQSALCRQ